MEKGAPMCVKEHKENIAGMCVRMYGPWSGCLERVRGLNPPRGWSNRPLRKPSQEAMV